MHKLLRCKWLIVGFLFTVSYSYSDSDRWVPIKNPDNVKLFYDSKTVKNNWLGVNLWLKYPSGSVKLVSLDCKNRTMEGSPIPPESLIEAVYDQLCDQPIELKPAAINQESTQDIDLGPWIAELQRRIRRNWLPETNDRKKRVAVEFRIYRDGRLIRSEIKESSGSSKADQAAINSIQTSAPFKKFPSSFNEEFLDITFVFDYETYGHGKAQIEPRH